MPQLDLTWYAAQSFWLAITFALLFLVVAKVLLPRLLNTVEARDATKSELLAAADQFRKDAANAEKKYEVAMSDARERAKSLFVDAELSIQNLTDRANKQMDAKMADRLKDAEKNIAAKQLELKQYFEQAGAALVVDVTAKLTGNAPALVEAQKAFTNATNKAS